MIWEFFCVVATLQILLLVAKEVLESVEKIITSQRPSWRADVASVDTNRSSVLLMDDLTLFAHGKSISCNKTIDQAFPFIVLTCK